MLKRLTLTTVIATLLVAFASTVSAQSWEILNDGGRCIHEAVIFEYDDTGEDGILINAYEEGGLAYDLLVTQSQLNDAAGIYDDAGNLVGARSVFVAGFDDITVVFENGGTPIDFSDDTLNIFVETLFNPETVACVFVLDAFANVGPENMTVYEQYPDGRLFLNSGN